MSGPYHEYEEEQPSSPNDRPSNESGESFEDEPVIEMRPLQQMTAGGAKDSSSITKSVGSDGIFNDTIVQPNWRESLDDFLFPPNLPRSCQLLRPENIAIPMCYLLVGLLQGLSSPLINVLPLDLGASEAQQTTLSGIRSLPASFKLIFGFLSDNIPIAGYRRKPYMIMGWLLASASLFMLILFTNLDVTTSGQGCFTNNENENEDADNAAEPPEDAPSIPFLAVSLLLFGVGFWLADVMGDSIVAEKAKLEPPESRGSIQSSCYSYRFFGLMLAAPCSTYMYSAFGPYSVLMVSALLPLCILPAIWMLAEQRNLEIKSTPEQCREIWNTVSSRAAWQPMGFVFLYNLLQVGNAAWKQFQRTVLGFTSCQLNLILIVAYVVLYLGILAYKYFLIKYSWRNIYIVATLLNGVFSALQVLLIYGITFGLSPFLFALGDDVFAEFIQGIQFLPTTIMMVHLCPAGSEGASYAMFTTVNNSALTLASQLSTMLLPIWDVSEDALAAGDLTGMVNLTYLTTGIQLSAILFVGWLPHTKEGLSELQSKGTSFKGGFIFLAVTFLSISYAIFSGILNIVAPGWMGES